MNFENEEYYERIMNKDQESSSYSETSNSCFSSNKQENYEEISIKSCHTTPKRLLKHNKNDSDNESLQQKIRSKKIARNELSELKKIEIELVKEMDSARSTSRNSSENRKKNENCLLKKIDRISLLELEILTETINIDSKNNDQNATIQDILLFIDRLKGIFAILNNKKILFPLDYYKKWILEYNKITNYLYNSNKELIINYEYNLKLNIESIKLIRSFFYYFHNLSELFLKEKKNNKKITNNNFILKQDNIKLSHLIKSLKFNSSNKDSKKLGNLSIEKILEMTINSDNTIEKKFIDVIVGSDEQINLVNGSIDNNNSVNDHILTNLISNENNQTLSKIDSINEISMLRTGRFQDAQNYREGIMKITQEYNGLYDRTRNEYIERLLERQKNHDMEIKLMITSHKEDIDKMNDYFIEEKKKISEQHDRQLNELLQENKRKIDIMKSDHSLELRLVQQKYKQIINDNNKEKDNSIQAFKIKFEHILIDMESNKDRELLNMQIEYEDKINELKENYKNIIDNLELELQRKELQFQEEKKMIINEFVAAHKKEVEILKSQSIKSFDNFDRDIENKSAIDTNTSNNDSINNENIENNKKDTIILSDDKKYNEIIKRLDNITSRSSLKVEGGKIGFCDDKYTITTNSTASSSAIPSNNVC
ncbi:uncharacterized protein cubi_01338 [Cryptosporidium ubiquitum]|uniref:Uncharacterized protein n=1 Tax=Cryptosporidium ubiquitum TaxID=857276 RepID=A0A1J4MGM4_9CRYT|nr:uncharacterized protein cubi_01338 [Cryptosporidium ubiquitum]OII72005.1 hypothetical protein cubi_01338 [Cryptosporidium ubiquitum]